MSLTTRKHVVFNDSDLDEESAKNKHVDEFKAKYDAKRTNKKKRHFEEGDNVDPVESKNSKRPDGMKNDSGIQVQEQPKLKKRRLQPDKTQKPGRGTQNDGEKPDWKKVKNERKMLKMKRKISSSGGNEIYDMGVRAKKIWEELRSQKCSVDQKKKLCEELWGLIRGKTKSLIYAHDTVRVIETLLSGGEEYRSKIFLELKDDLLDLAKNKYSKFFVLKLLRYGTPEQKNAVMTSMNGHIVPLMRHKVACDVVELAYNDYANAKQRSNMIQEFFGPRFKHFKEDISTLAQAIEKNPNLKDSILADLTKALEPILDKGVFTNILVHALLKEYMYVCGEAEKRNVIESIKDGLLPIVHTRDGARVAMLCLWNGTIKEKKKILKSFKGKFAQIACEEHGHMVLLAAFDCTDDTAFIAKAVLSELMKDIKKLVENETGRKVLKYLVAPRNKVFFHPDILKVLQEGDGNPHSKKDRDVKYKEIQEYISQPILKLIYDNIKTWSKISQWTLFIGAALQSFSGELIIPIFEALAEICADPFIPGEETHFLEVGYISKMISYVIQCDKARFQESKPIFSTYLFDVAETEMRGWSITNRGCFILVKLIETEIPEIVANITRLCIPIKSKLSGLNFKGAEILLKKLNG